MQWLQATRWRRMPWEACSAQNTSRWGGDNGSSAEAGRVMKVGLCLHPSRANSGTCKECFC